MEQSDQLKSKIIVFTGPSGVGKSVIEEIIFSKPELRLGFSISATTRKPRPGEENGREYYFISQEEFEKRIANEEFVEWNQHFEHKYGTLKSELKRLRAENLNPFLEIEVIGAKNIAKMYDKNEMFSIFIAPPTMEALQSRIRNRQTEDETEIEKRMQRVELELSYSEYFTHVVINDNPDRAAQEVAEIILRNTSYGQS